MTTLQNYPNLNQRIVPINGELDCVPTSLADGLEYLTGKQYNVYDIVTAAYGPNYRGFTSASKFVPFCASQGVKLFPVDGDNVTLVQDLHHYIQNGCPCLLTEPDIYAPLHPTWTDVLSVYSEAPGTLTARDPYSTHDVTHADSTWQSLLEFREIWILQKENTDMPITVDIHTPTIAAYFKEIDADHWQCLHNGVILGGDIRKWYCDNGYVPDCGLSSHGLPITGEIPIEKVGQDAGYPFAHLAGHDIKVQYFERGVICFDPNTPHMVDTPVGSGATYPLQIYNDSVGTDPAVWKLQALNATLEQQVTTLPQLQAQLAQAQAQIAALQAQQSQSSTPDPRIAHYAGQLATVNGLAQQTVGLAQQIVQESTVQ